MEFGGGTARAGLAWAPALAGCLLLGCATLELRTGSEPVDGQPVATDEAGAEPAPAASNGPVLVLRGASVMTAAGPTFPRADVVLRGDRIVSVSAPTSASTSAGAGAGSAAAAGVSLPPADARVVDVSGRWITPGLIDPHSHRGVYPLPHVRAHADGNEATSPFTPEVRARDSLWPQDPGIEAALAGGVTTLHVLPGSANLVGGQGFSMRALPGLSASALEVPDAPTTMKMACGENPKMVYGVRRKSAPSTRMGEIAMLRQELAEAKSWEPDPEKATDYAKQALSRVVSGETLVQNHCYRADEMLLRLELFAELGFKPRAFHHAVEAYKIADALREADVAAVVWADWWGVKMELLDAVPANAAILQAHGARVALHSDSPNDVQRLNQQAAKAWAAGRRAGIEVTRDEALRWVTANPAWVLGLEDRIGTLEAGKQADLVVWSGDPFSVYSVAEQVYIAGELVFERSAARAPRSDFELGLRAEGEGR